MAKQVCVVVVEKSASHRLIRRRLDNFCDGADWIRQERVPKFEGSYLPRDPTTYRDMQFNLKILPILRGNRNGG